MIKLKLLIAAFITLNFNFFCWGMDDQQLLDAIKKDDVETIKNALEKKELYINHIITIDENNMTSILSWAIRENAKNTISLLINKKADLNFDELIKDQTFSNLFLSLIHSTPEITELIINESQKQNCLNLGHIATARLFSKEPRKLSLFDSLIITNIPDDQKKFITKFLIGFFKKEVIHEALKNTNFLQVIEILVANGAFIPTNILEIATKLNVSKEIQEYFEYQLGISKIVMESIINMPQEVAETIAKYSYDAPKNLDELLIEAIEHKNERFIFKFLENKKNINYLVKYDNIEYSLLALAIKKSAEGIARYLVLMGADVNFKIKYKDYIFTPLYFSFLNDDISTNFIEFLINKGANIYHCLTKIQKKSNFDYNVFCIFYYDLDKIDDSKKTFITNFLINKFQENILDFVIENNELPLYMIKRVMNLDKVRITEFSIEKAKKLKHPKSTISFLKKYLKLYQSFEQNNVKLPSNALTLITEYNDKTKQEKNCIIS